MRCSIAPACRVIRDPEPVTRDEVCFLKVNDFRLQILDELSEFEIFSFKTTSVAANALEVILIVGIKHAGSLENFGAVRPIVREK
ncbi:hypothetical protein AVEN_152750-1 [Araneus ventricosus]|uniref:Uncharacterized protein n=1 Tax=Araneus ventricosus TaxID=182803 RepID=A0A4Y2KX22_ARAVE|nr:hypothetical protein AVEN_152750-1 [Araneus ventricosus]